MGGRTEREGKQGNDEKMKKEMMRKGKMIQRQREELFNLIKDGHSKTL